jgi:hypothetical protein
MKKNKTKRCVYSIYVPLQKYRNKHGAFQAYYSKIITAHKKYANLINADYVLFEKLPEMDQIPSNVSYYDKINFSKYYYAEELCQTNYDEILYIDFDVIPNTKDNFFTVFNVNEYVAVKSTIPYNSQMAIEYVKQFESTITAVAHNQHIDKYNQLKNEYNKGITATNFHGIPWIVEKTPKEFEKKYTLDWWLEKHNFKKPNPLTYIKEGRNPNNIKSWDDAVKYAAIDILTEGKAIFYNTGVMGFCKNTLAQLNIFDGIEEYCTNTSNGSIRDEVWPEYVTSHIDINNEVLFSYKMIINNVPVKDIGRDWNYFVDWSSDLLQLSSHTFYDEFDSCKFRHFLNKNFEKQWPT